jgi:hypothetical protein
VAHITLYCSESPNLKLGPGTIDPLDTTSQRGGTEASPGDQVIVFFEGFAEFETERFPKWESWVKHSGTPYIEINPEGGLVPLGTGFPCDVCAGTKSPKSFGSARQLAGHMMSHRTR